MGKPLMLFLSLANGSEPPLSSQSMHVCVRELSHIIPERWKEKEEKQITLRVRTMARCVGERVRMGAGFILCRDSYGDLISGLIR